MDFWIWTAFGALAVLGGMLMVFALGLLIATIADLFNIGKEYILLGGFLLMIFFLMCVAAGKMLEKLWVLNAT